MLGRTKGFPFPSFEVQKYERLSRFTKITSFRQSGRLLLAFAWDILQPNTTEHQTSFEEICTELHSLLPSQALLFIDDFLTIPSFSIRVLKGTVNMCVNAMISPNVTNCFSNIDQLDHNAMLLVFLGSIYDHSEDTLIELQIQYMMLTSAATPRTHESMVPQSNLFSKYVPSKNQLADGGQRLVSEIRPNDFEVDDPGWQRAPDPLSFANEAITHVGDSSQTATMMSRDPLRQDNQLYQSFTQADAHLVPAAHGYDGGDPSKSQIPY